MDRKIVLLVLSVFIIAVVLDWFVVIGSVPLARAISTQNTEIIIPSDDAFTVRHLLNDVFSVSLTAERWVLIEDLHGDRLKVETVSDEVWAQLVQLYYNGSKRWIGGIVERYENEWGFRFDPETIIVAEITAEGLQSNIRFISLFLDYWLGGWAYVWANVTEIHQTPLVGGVWVSVDRLGLLAPYIALVSTIILTISASAVYIKYRKKQ